MKLRIQGNVIRFRLNRSEVGRFASEGRVSASLRFPNGSALTYTLQTAPIDSVEAAFSNDEILVRVSGSIVGEWSRTEQVGIEVRAGAMEVLIEKDFQCMHKGEGAKDPDAYPNPAAGEAP